MIVRRRNHQLVNSCCTNCAEGKTCESKLINCPPGKSCPSKRINGDFSDIVDRVASGQPLTIIGVSVTDATIVKASLAFLIVNQLTKK